MSEKYLIWSEEHGGWWRPARWGYTQRMVEAGLYDATEAGDIVRGANMGRRFNEIAVPLPDAFEGIIAAMDRNSPAPET